MREKILDKYGLSDDAKGNVLCLTSLVLKLDERIEALTSANNELIKTVEGDLIKLAQEGRYDEVPLENYYGTVLCKACIKMETETDWDEYESRWRERIAEANEY